MILGKTNVKVSYEKSGKIILNNGEIIGETRNCIIFYSRKKNILIRKEKKLFWFSNERVEIKGDLLRKKNREIFFY